MEINASFVKEDEKTKEQNCHVPFSIKNENAKNIVLLGSGDMTMALAINFLRAELNPVVASRNPERARSRLKKMRNLEVNVATIEAGVSLGDVVVVAIPAEHHGSLSVEALRGKILIDISNRSPSEPSGGPSNAEKLQELHPESFVVKAFNTLSSYALTQGNIQGSREVPICGDSEEARNRVAGLVRDIGLTPVDHGSLSNARAIEDIPLSFFPEWRTAFIVTPCIFLFYFIFVLLEKQLCPNFTNNDNSTSWDWQPFNYLPLLNVQFSLAYTAATLLLATYIPGCLAGYIQLYRGTKYSQFPDWLDNWMKTRKQFGLLTLFLGGLHGCSAIFTQMTWGMNYPEKWYEQLYCMVGPTLLGILAILGITSLPSVSARLTWREFSIIQRYLGWTCVLLLTIHDGFSNFAYLLDAPSCVYIPTTAQFSVILCLLTILLKIPLVLPCVDLYLMKIRNGYERGSSKSSPA
ncbi:metalloreductase STEAP3-like [Palaemon carinicauda]|uniref:metalloreductase STEAP3-like n=1 Tax=Palaemon carinicauda TaxID=392227 RepID=UPI0035B6AA55